MPKRTKVVVGDKFFSILDRIYVVAGRSWSLFKGGFITKIAWARFGVVIIDRWSLFGGGC